MRCGMVLEAFSEHYRISLLAIPRRLEPLPEFFRRLCEHVAIVPPHVDPEYRIEQSGQIYRVQDFDVVHVFRLASLPFARPYFKQAHAIHLDLDDIESKTYRRIANLYRNAGEVATADLNEGFAKWSLMLETFAFRTFHRVYVCSEQDRRELLDRCAIEIRVLRNAVHLPRTVSPPRISEEFRFLFVGNLGYYPNEDAVRYFCEQILPLIRQGARTRFRVDFVGAGAPQTLFGLSAADVHVVGPVTDVQPWYEACHAVIVPLRAGGGTRIKILEAFSYQRAVVTTPIGIEGIDAEPNRHVLVADLPESFASACLQLMANPAWATDLGQNANSLVRLLYSSEALKATVGSM